MNKRERLLAITVGLLIGVILLFYGSKYVYSAFDSRQQAIERLQKEIREKKLQVRLGKRASARLARYEAKSLPANAELALSLYQKRLLAEVEKIGLKSVNVGGASSRMEGNVFRELSFSVTGRGTLAQLTQMLHQFYRADILHRLRRLRIKPIPDTKELDLAFTIEALSLPGALETSELPKGTSSRLKEADFQAYEDAIVGRNLFAPANQPPRLGTLSRKSGTTGKALEFSATAKDDDPLDSIAFTLIEGPEGAKVDSQGKFRWTPRQAGKYEAIIEVFDDGVPKKTDRKTVELVVSDPPPPKPPEPEKPKPPPKLQFDSAKFAYVSAIIEVAGRRQLWLTNRTNDELLKLFEGDKVKIGSINGVVEQIGPMDVVIAASEKRYLISLGENLLEGLPLDEVPN